MRAISVCIVNGTATTSSTPTVRDASRNERVGASVVRMMDVSRGTKLKPCLICLAKVNPESPGKSAGVRPEGDSRDDGDRQRDNQRFGSHHSLETGFAAHA